MMPLYHSLLQSLAILVGLILIALLLRSRGIITVEQKPIFGKLVTDLALPALIFTSLSRQALVMSELKAVEIMMLSLFSCMFLAWVVGRALRLDPARLGAFVMVAAFGSSSTLGYALISQTFPNNPSALSEAVVISELGVGIPIFTVGVAVAIFFGRQESSSPMEGLRTFLTSPIFAALMLGLAVSLLNLSFNNPVWDVLIKILDV
jgi:predicted permease